MTQQLTNMSIDKVALVDRGANGRQFAILKRDGAPEPDPVKTPAELAELWKAADAADPLEARRSVLEVVKGWLGLAPGEPVAKAQTFAAIVAGRQLTDALYDSWWTLEDALWGAMWATDADGVDLSIEAKKGLVAQNLDEFKAWLLGQMDDATAIAKRDDGTPDQRALASLLRKVAGDDTERGSALTKAAEPLIAALGDGGSPDPEDLTKRAQPEEDDMDPTELAKALAPALQPMIESAVDTALEKRAAAQPQAAPPAAAITKTEDAAPAGPVTEADILKVLVGMDERLTAIEKGRSAQQSLGGQEGGVAKRSPLAGILD